MTQIRNIVILGASFSGLGTAHYIAKHILPQLQKTADTKYVLHLVDPSTHFWWHIAAPREIVLPQNLKAEQCFVPIMDGFKQYGNLRDSIIFHHGTASALDTEARTVTVSLHEGGSESLEYYALIIATGVRSPTAATTLHGDHSISLKALKDLNTKLASAKEVLISGGGPVGVEIAGEVAIHLKGKAKVTLYSGSSKILPVFSESRAAKAQKLLEKNGVTVVHNAKTTGSQQTADGKTEVTLDNGKTVTTDVYIPAYGVTPNTEFVPENLKTKSGYVQTNATTLRVDGAGARVYAAGDVAAVDAGGVLNMYNTLPILGANIAHDLLADAKAGNVAEKKYTFKPAETQFVPVGPKAGVAAFNGMGIPGFVVSMVKGKDYMIGQIPGFTEGKKFVKA
ncbi:hypothetical protein M409DRAFT_27851 [Zasmidium cellare ATCC 36951]|uniref:FAD/NAD(P)-binding domain-containing protein n=1 Tax=Zasmidium cellare ATCC 36951 TaxID=1080233 RepID=A0A6A6C3V2_ZASCE|nr:uncharacterized protein M409DRAFT_27851 [Zasmidium cellare ATCC 36951]KAF2161794.1 hypothetical protein M409DRAFT_27851 [Zasmidium cellare ATCC 36951]